MTMPPVIPNATGLDGTETMLVRQGGPLRRATLALLKAFVQSPSTYLGDIMVSEKMAVSLVAPTMRQVRVALKGVKKDSALVFCPVSPVPAGFAFGAPSSGLDDFVDVPVFVPALSLGQTYSVSGKIMVLR